MITTIVPATLNETKNKLVLLDQTLLPEEVMFLELTKVEEVWEAIKKLRVRGAPAIGIAAAFGIFVSMLNEKKTSIKDYVNRFKEMKTYLETSRPTAVNLFWALNRMERVLLDSNASSVEEINSIMLNESELILKEDQDMSIAIGHAGLTLLQKDWGLLTHCNAGGIATSGFGTALAPMYVGHEQGYNFRVFSDETRPLLQGSRITAFELNEAGIDVTVITDSMANQVMKEGKIQAILVGTDRIAANGDVANKIGTSGLAILAKEYDIPFYVLGPSSTVDMNTPTGDDIEIELRNPDEIGNGFGRRTAPTNVKAYNPAFDVTPNKYVTAIITEKGVLRQPYSESLKILFEEKI